MDVGMVPASEFTLRSSSSSDESNPIDDGMVPTKKLFSKMSSFSEVMSPIVVGIVLLKELIPTSNFVILLKLPISDGIKPTSPSLLKSISSTLA